jgi:lipopolysaccharide cholinephosphotransferase
MCLQTISLKESQAAMLELLKIIDKVCRDNNLQYWLDHGTLLGAVRHKGYIPWDDDVDICVMKKDYDQLLDLLEKESQKNKDIFLLFRSNNANDQYWCEYLCTSKQLFGYGKKELIPLRVDIFPMKSMPPLQENKDRLLTDVAKYFIQGKPNNPELLDDKYIKKTLPEALKAKEEFMSFYNGEYMSSCNATESTSLVTYSYGDNISKYPSYFTYSDIFPLKEIEFEGNKFYCPNNTNKYLSILYGDYLDLPPKAQQKPYKSKFYLCDNHEIVRKIGQEEVIDNESLFFRKYTYKYIIKRFFWLLRYKGIYHTIKLIN